MGVASGGGLAAGGVADKALRLVEQRRVLPMTPDRMAVLGDTADYHVTAGPLGVVCTCRANGVCSHAVAAMLVWHEGRAR